MHIEDSEFIRVATREANRRIHEEAVDDDCLRWLFFDCIQDAATLLPHWHAWSSKKSRLRAALRARHAQKTRRRLLKRFARAFQSFELAIASAEFVNVCLVGALDSWRSNNQSVERPPMLGLKDQLPGRDAKFLFLLGMHARMVRVAGEVHLLLQAGYHEGAASRSRTLYELLVKALLICNDKSETGYELTERYYAMAHMESYDGSKYRGNDEVIREIRRAACDRWGKDYFDDVNNWARPAIGNPSKKRVTFRDMEDAAESQEARHLYIESNHAVHVGSRMVIESTDFRRSYLNNMRTEVDLRATSRIGQASTFYLEVSTMILTEKLACEMKEWDSGLSAAEFIQQIQLANMEFAQMR